MQRYSSLICAALLLAASHVAIAKDRAFGDTIVIGQSAPFSGPSAQLGMDFNRGARMYFQSVNEGGGVHGRKIELRAKDDAYDPDQTARNTAALLEDARLVALFGYVGTTTSMAAMPLVNSAHVPFFAPVSGAEAFRRPLNRNVFNIRASCHDEAEYIIDQLTVTGIKNIAVFHQNDAYGHAGLDAMNRALAKRGGKVHASAVVARHGTDVAAAAKSLQAAHPGGVVLVSAYGSAAALIKEMRRSGYRGQFVSMSYVGGGPLADELGDAGVGVIVAEVVPFPWGEATALQREFRKAMQKAGEVRLSFGAMEGYLAAKTLVEGLRRAGPELTRARLVAALETMTNWDAGGTRISFSHDDHSGSHFVEMTMIGAGGRFVH
jgi:branched-chain amino acid transport system substrate-binding protein